MSISYVASFRLWRCCAHTKKEAIASFFIACIYDHSLFSRSTNPPLDRQLLRS